MQMRCNHNMHANVYQWRAGGKFVHSGFECGYACYFRVLHWNNLFPNIAGNLQEWTILYMHNFTDATDFMGEQAKCGAIWASHFFRTNMLFLGAKANDENHSLVIDIFSYSLFLTSAPESLEVKFSCPNYIIPVRYKGLCLYSIVYENPWFVCHRSKWSFPYFRLMYGLLLK